MELYKYLIDDRIDVLQNGMIRFTQHEDLNDPFDLAPEVEALIGEGEMPAFMKGMRGRVEERYHPENAVNTVADLMVNVSRKSGSLDLTKADERLFRERFASVAADRPDFTEKLLKLDRLIATSVLGIAAPIVSVVDKNVAGRMTELLNETLGVLSLTEAFDSMPMWAHYGGNHIGPDAVVRTGPELGSGSRWPWSSL